MFPPIFYLLALPIPMIHARLSIKKSNPTGKRSIRIAVPYFVPDNSMLEELTLAHLRGVEIEIYLQTL